MFKILCLIAFVIGSYFNYSTDAVETPLPSHTKYLYANDYGGYLSQDTEAYIIREGAALCQRTKAQIAVAVVPNTGGKSLEEYSRDLANKWGLGDAKLNNGVLILFTADGKPRVRLEVGRGLEGAINDAKAGRILDDYAVEPKNAKHFNQAAIDTFRATAAIVYENYNLPVPQSIIATQTIVERGETGGLADGVIPKPKTIERSFSDKIIDAFIGGLAFLFVFLILYAIGKVFSFVGFAGGGGFSGGGGGFSGGGGSFGGGGASR